MAAVAVILTELGVLDARLCWVLRCHIDNFKGVGLLLAEWMEWTNRVGLLLPGRL